MQNFKIPAITPAQILALVGTVLALIVSFGADIDAHQQEAILSLTAVLAGVMIGGDWLIRLGRATHLAPAVAAGTIQKPFLRDITPAQIVAVLGAIIAVAVSFGAPISAPQRDNFLMLVQIVGGVLLAGDAALRYGRARALVKTAEAEKVAQRAGVTR